MAEVPVLTSTTLTALPKIAEGKVRDLFEVDSKTLLFVASDRISAYDVIMQNVCLPSINWVPPANRMLRVFLQKDLSSTSSLPTGSTFFPQ